MSTPVGDVGSLQSRNVGWGLCPRGHEVEAEFAAARWDAATRWIRPAKQIVRRRIDSPRGRAPPRRLGSAPRALAGGAAGDVEAAAAAAPGARGLRRRCRCALEPHRREAQGRGRAGARAKSAVTAGSGSAPRRLPSRLTAGGSKSATFQMTVRGSLPRGHVDDYTARGAKIGRVNDRGDGCWNTKLALQISSYKAHTLVDQLFHRLVRKHLGMVHHGIVRQRLNRRHAQKRCEF